MLSMDARVGWAAGAYCALSLGREVGRVLPSLGLSFRVRTTRTDVSTSQSRCDEVCKTLAIQKMLRSCHFLFHFRAKGMLHRGADQAGAGALGALAWGHVWRRPGLWAQFQAGGPGRSAPSCP